MLLNDDIVDIEKPDGICSFTFVVNEFSILLFSVFVVNESSSTFSIKH